MYIHVHNTLCATVVHCVVHAHKYMHMLNFCVYLKQMKNPSGFQKGAYRDGVKREETSQGWDWKHTS